MKFHELNVTKAKSPKRVGRGIAAGQGKTAGRGTKGQKSRTGSTKNPGFVGGQNPLMQALPKLPGFKSHRIKAENVYTGQLDQFAGKTADSEALAAAGIISNAYVNVKLISNGDVTKKVTVKVQSASASAIEAVEKAGGSFTAVPRLGRAESTRKTSRAANKKEA